MRKTSTISCLIRVVVVNVKCELGAMVTVVDASTFLDDFQCDATLSQREDLGEWQPGDLAIWGGNRRHVVDLLTVQVTLPTFPKL